MEKELYYFSPPSLLSARTAQLGLVSYAARFPRVTYSLSPQRPSRPAQQRHLRSPLSRRVSLTSRSRLSIAFLLPLTRFRARLRRRRKSTSATTTSWRAAHATPSS